MSDTEEIAKEAETTALRAVALYEAAKGLIALLAASGIAWHKETARWIERLSRHLHLNPAREHPNAIWHAIQANATAHLRLIAFGALVYAIVRFAEAIGLWYDRRWASWLGVISAAAYLPFEAVNVIRRGTWVSVAFLTGTVLVILFLLHHLQLRQAKFAARAQT